MKNTAKLYFRNTGVALLSIWVGIVIYLLLSSVSGLLTLHDYTFNLWSRIRINTFYIWLPWVVLTPLALWFAEKMPVKPSNWVLGVFVHLFLLLLLAVVHGYASARAYYFIGDLPPDMMTYAAWQHTGHFLFMDDMFLFDALIYIFLIASKNITNFHSLAQQKELDALRMQGQLTESRLQALLMQVNPHFLFNTLNSIAVLVRKNDMENANSMIEKLSAFFRHTLETSAEQWVSLQQELGMMDQYLDIEKVRLGPRLSVTKSVPQEVLGFPVPMLITQPLVENAIKHGIAQKPGPCRLSIEATLRQGRLILTLTDTGAGCDFGSEEDAGKGIGLNNVRERLRQSYGSAAQLSLKGIRGNGVQVTLDLPDSRQNGEALS